MNQITPEELKSQLTANHQLFLLDVRELYEHAEFNIGGKLVPLNEVIANHTNIPRDQPVIVYCKKGIRSQIAIQRLEEKFGFTNLVNLRGGMDAWKKVFDL